MYRFHCRRTSLRNNDDTAQSPCKGAVLNAATKQWMITFLNMDEFLAFIAENESCIIERSTMLNGLVIEIYDDYRE